MENKEFQLFEQLPKLDSIVLTAINKDLVMANPQRKITEKERLGISNFISLFEDDGIAVKWFDQTLPKQTVDVRDNLRKKLENAQSELSNYDKTYKNISIEKDAISHKKEIENLKKKRNASESDIISLENYPNPSFVEQEEKNRIL